MPTNQYGTFVVTDDPELRKKLETEGWSAEEFDTYDAADAYARKQAGVDLGTLGTAKRGITAGLVQTFGAPGSWARAAGGATGIQALENIGYALEKSEAEQMQALAPPPDLKTIDVTEPRWWAYAVGNIIPSLGTQVLANVALGGLGVPANLSRWMSAGLVSAVEGADAISESIAKGDTGSVPFMKGVGTTVGVAWLNKLSFDTMFPVAGTGVGSKLAKIGRSALTESVTEALEEPLQDIAVWSALQPDLVERMVAVGLPSFLVGGVGGAFGAMQGEPLSPEDQAIIDELKAPPPPDLGPMGGEGAPASRKTPLGLPTPNIAGLLPAPPIYAPSPESYKPPRTVEYFEKYPGAAASPSKAAEGSNWAQRLLPGTIIETVDSKEQFLVVNEPETAQKYLIPMEVAQQPVPLTPAEGGNEGIPIRSQEGGSIAARSRIVNGPGLDIGPREMYSAPLTPESLSPKQRATADAISRVPLEPGEEERMFDEAVQKQKDKGLLPQAAMDSTTLKKIVAGIRAIVGGIPHGAALGYDEVVEKGLEPLLSELLYKDPETGKPQIASHNYRQIRQAIDSLLKDDVSARKATQSGFSRALRRLKVEVLVPKTDRNALTSNQEKQLIEVFGKHYGWTVESRKGQALIKIVNTLLRNGAELSGLDFQSFLKENFRGFHIEYPEKNAMRQHYLSRIGEHEAIPIDEYGYVGRFWRLEKGGRGDLATEDLSAPTPAKKGEYSWEPVSGTFITGTPFITDPLTALHEVMHFAIAMAVEEDTADAPLKAAIDKLSGGRAAFKSRGKYVESFPVLIEYFTMTPSEHTDLPADIQEALAEVRSGMLEYLTVIDNVLPKMPNVAPALSILKSLLSGKFDYGSVPRYRSRVNEFEGLFKDYNAMSSYVAAVATEYARQYREEGIAQNRTIRAYTKALHSILKNLTTEARATISSLSDLLSSLNESRLALSYTHSVLQSREDVVTNKESLRLALRHMGAMDAEYGRLIQETSTAIKNAKDLFDRSSMTAEVSLIELTQKLDRILQDRASESTTKLPPLPEGADPYKQAASRMLKAEIEKAQQKMDKGLYSAALVARVIRMAATKVGLTDERALIDTVYEIAPDDPRIRQVAFMVPLDATEEVLFRLQGYLDLQLKSLENLYSSYNRLITSPAQHFEDSFINVILTSAKALEEEGKKYKSPDYALTILRDIIKESLAEGGPLSSSTRNRFLEVLDSTRWAGSFGDLIYEPRKAPSPETVERFFFNATTRVKGVIDFEEFAKKETDAFLGKGRGKQFGRNARFRRWLEAFEQPGHWDIWEEQGVKVAREVPNFVDEIFDHLMNGGRPNTPIMAGLHHVMLLVTGQIEPMCDQDRALLRENNDPERKALIIKTVRKLRSEAGRTLAEAKRERQLEKALLEFGVFIDALSLKQTIKLLPRLQEIKKKIVESENPMATLRHELMSVDTSQFVKRLLMSMFYNSLLSHPGTHIINTLSNTLWLHALAGHRMLVGAVDSVYSNMTGRRRSVYAGEGMLILRAMYNGFGGSWGQANQAFKNAFKRTGLAKTVTKTEEEMGLVDPKSGELRTDPIEEFLQRKFGESGRKVAIGMTTPSRLLIAMDAWIKAIAEKGQEEALRARFKKLSGVELEVAKVAFIKSSLQNWRLVEHRLRDYKIKNKYQLKKLIATDESIKDNMGRLFEAAIRNDMARFAEHSTFQDMPGPITEQVLKLRNRLGPIGRVAIPFIQTITNITKRGLELTPGVGVAVSLHGKQSSQEIVAKQLEAAVITLLIYAMIESGRLTGAPPEDKEERDLFYAEGKLPYSVNFGGTYFQYRRLEPFGLPVSLLADLYSSWKDAETDEGAFDLFVSSVMVTRDHLVDNTWMRTVAAGLGDEYSLKNQLWWTTGSFVPYSGFWRGLNQQFEMWRTGEVKIKDRTFLSTFGQSLPPGLSDLITAQSRVNAMGEEVGRKPPFDMRAFPWEWIPVRFSTETPDPVEEVFREIGYYPTYPGKYLTLRPKGKRVELPDEVYRDYVLTTGRKAKESVMGLVTRPYFKSLPTSRKRKLVMDRWNKVRDKERENVRRYLRSAEGRRKLVQEQTVSQQEGEG